MRKEVNLCDQCKKRIGTSHCEFCVGDLCGLCTKTYSWNQNGNALFKLSGCRNCKDRINKFIHNQRYDKNMFTKKSDYLDAMKVTIIEDLKKYMIIDSLDEEKKK